ncbi:MAG: hypothetical protein WAO21_08535 [Verrucomicrobiia bacterium]
MKIKKLFLSLGFMIPRQTVPICRRHSGECIGLSSRQQFPTSAKNPPCCFWKTREMGQIYELDSTQDWLANKYAGFNANAWLLRIVKIYHGTTEAIGRRALTEGLKPRKMTGKSNWQHTVESSPSLIYLTTAYAPYFALHAFTSFHKTKFAIVEIETNLLDKTKLRPDEDFIEQATRRDEKNSAGIRGKTINERTEYIRNHIDEFSESWRLSVEHLGNCAYKGVIEPVAITRVSVVDISKCKSMCYEAMEPVITILNYNLCGAQYRMLNRWFMGEPVTVDEWFQTQSVNPLNFMDEKEKPSAIKMMTKKLSNQSCIKIISARHRSRHEHSRL